ncbi:30S ribosomal protein S4 [Candidatus Aciduliprofundum boonei]|uniref:Small ribosomal subunit protein uS4 n=1 Tax=Aciduliprofundum boonei (strain DSM 19572 / T469) TaxID=439481 RepID=B5ID29_ACIB4|nr:30S ribosomal protein S4 [Candidatus Aciduliprofundum boonei]ADD09204.1 ribosomal protein S4 [Aciduliprofundum boonei T469]EDY35834.1 ribosomal protein S4 [Aciduliprofundum boonei T469]HII55832.1 30S ribosomal protein S4 [Candidatus Aciduliprofundum boonei]
MGDPRFNRKKYETPKHPWEADRIKEEWELQKKYGLKNKREIWKAKSLLRNFRGQARQLQAKLRYGNPQAEKEQKLLFDKLIRLGILNEANATLDAVLSLTVEDILRRRLQTIVYLKGLARTPKQARQFIVHGHIAIGDRKVTIPSYLVRKEEEDLVDYYKYSPLADEMHPMRPQVIEGQEEVKEEGE